MHKDVVSAQAETLQTWADQWELEAGEPGSDGYGEVTMLLRRAAAQMKRCMGVAMPDFIQEPPAATATEELRDD